MGDLEKMTDWSKLNTLLQSGSGTSQRHVVDEAKLLAHLQSRVKGQDEILKDVARTVRLSWMKDIFRPGRKPGDLN